MVSQPPDVTGPALPVLRRVAFESTEEAPTDDARSLNVALQRGGTVIIRDGNYRLRTTLVIGTPRTLLQLPCGTLSSNANPVLLIRASDVMVRGCGYFGTELYNESATNDAIVVDGRPQGISGVTLRDFSIPSHSSGDLRSGGTAIRLSSVGDWALSGVYIRDPWVGLDIDNASTGFVSNVVIDTTLPSQSLHTGIRVRHQSVSTHFSNVMVTSQKTPFEFGWYIGSDTDTFSCRMCGVQGNAAYGFATRRDEGEYAPRWLRIIHPFVEVAPETGIGFDLGPVRDVSITDAYSVWGLHNVRVGADAQTVKVRGGTAQLAYKHGVLIEGGSDIMIDGVTISDAGQSADNKYDGIAIAANMAGGVRISNCTSGNVIWRGSSPASATNRQRYGISIAAGRGDRYTIVNNDLDQNESGPLLDLGRGQSKVVEGNRPNGSGVAVLTKGKGTVKVYEGCRALCTSTSSLSAVRCAVAGGQLAIRSIGASDVVNWRCY